MGRNQLAQDFLDSDADKLFFLDSDVTFEPGAILNLTMKDADFVGGSYRFKHDTEQYPVAFIEGRDHWADRRGLMEVATLPGGFLSLSRKVFETLKAAHPERAYTHCGRIAHCYFQMRFEDGNLYGEDTYFCKEWRDTGGKVYLDPEINLTHWDFNKPYPGHIGNWLKRRAGLAVAC